MPHNGEQELVLSLRKMDEELLEAFIQIERPVEGPPAAAAASAKLPPGGADIVPFVMCHTHPFVCECSLC